MASNSTIEHRFANKDYNFERGLKGNSTHIEGNNYYSYSTVFGQWVDDKVCLVYWGSTSMTSNKHKLSPLDFPRDVTLLPYDDGGHGGYYNSWHGCDLLGWRGEFNFDKRAELIDYYVSEIYNALAAINGGTKKGLDTQAGRTICEYWGYVMKLCALYRDTTINKWLCKKRIDLDGEWKLRRRLVKELDAQNMDVKSLVDIVFGEGTYKAYYDYCARYRKSADKRAKVEALCKRLGIASPYENYSRERMNTELTADQIRKLTAKERMELHFKALARKEDKRHEDERKKKYNKNFRNAYKWIVGFEPKQKSWGGGYESDVHNNCVNKDNGVVYECSGETIYRYYWCCKEVSFNYDAFRKSESKEQWIADFYAKCKEVANNRKAIGILHRINAHTKEKTHSYDDNVYLNDDYLRENTTEAEYIICSEFIAKQDKHYADKEARRRAEEIARLKREEEERKEKELQEKITREKVAKMVAEGIEGCRNLWRLHIQDINTSRLNSPSTDGEFFFGGNVLLRFSMNKDKIESSKHIRVTIPTCKAMWKVVRKWHEHPETFKEMTIKTLDGTYTISSYKNDILTAGCHDIAYAEMEHMYNEIVKLENEAA